MIARRTLGVAFAGLATLAALTTIAYAADDWRKQVPVFRVGILGGENEADRLKDNACFKELLETRLGVPVELYPASDYAGVMQGLISKNLEYAGLGSAAYAGIVIQDPDAVEPLVTTEQIDGSLGYYSVLYVRADSPYKSIEDLKGKSLAFADPNSTSGYLVPAFELKQQGYDPAKFFSQTGFGGGHEQAVVAVLNKQYDAGVTWTSGVGELSEGYSRGNLRKMVDKGALDMKDIRVVWKSNLITNGPRVIRKDAPQELKDLVRGILVNMPIENRLCAEAIAGGEFNSFQPVSHDFYKTIIEMRNELKKARRG
ncbi:phosphate uptake ABC transporter periplasmic solute-binding protein precursor [alpha proteobacterium BAL199]|jgi:phosphonate transport system substrate-binding protein|nr:phosphate uptake ABC transporter periplasmic solute-binding protein precursor [alpha proteobacterium BAL199]